MKLVTNWKFFTMISIASNICLLSTYLTKFFDFHIDDSLEKSLNNRLVLVVTATYKHSTQMASMTNLMQTLREVPPPIHWIVIEDEKQKSDRIRNLLKRSTLQNSHLAFISSEQNPTLWDMKTAKERSFALQYIRHRFANQTQALIYFADANHIYDVRLFDLIRQVITIF